MKVLHICNDFCGSKVHANLYKRLDGLGVEQTVFTYYRGADKEGKNKFESQHTFFIYKGVLKIWHRVFYHLKIRKVYHELKKEIDPSDYDLVHAITLFSDGAIAFRLYKEYRIPYIVAVRNTDVNTFLGKAPYTWSMGLKIMINAERIVFVSKALKTRFCNHIAVKRILPDIQNKILLQPNGIDDYWLDNVNKEQKSLPHNVIYVGKFDGNKNVLKLISVILRLKQTFPNIKLHLVGGEGSKKWKVFKKVTKHPETLVYYGQIYDKELLKKIYRKCRILAMPSIHETFGLVYIEALTQNLTILYSRGQGVDEMFDSHIGVSVNGRSQKSIEDGLKKLLNQTSPYYISDNVDFEQFRWERIAEKYRWIYKEVLIDKSIRL